MDLSESHFTTQRGDRSDIRVEVLAAPVVCRRGIEYRGPDGDRLLAWDRVTHAVAALVGEPEGVCTIVFDLLVDAAGSPLRVCRFDADPTEGAIPLSVAIADYLGRERCDASVLAMAKEGSTGWWFSDLESFEAASIDRLQKRRPVSPSP
jgi:hypothetical protein